MCIRTHHLVHTYIHAHIDDTSEQGICGEVA